MKLVSRILIAWIWTAILISATPSAAAEKMLDLSHAVIVTTAPDKPVIAKGVTLLREEIEKRTRIVLPTLATMPPSDSPAVALVLGDVPRDLGTPPENLLVPDKAEGYALWVDTTTRKAPTIILAGRDERGVLFAVGRLLRLLELRPNSITLSDDIRIATAPRLAIRGHQIGYRAVNNTTDAWTLEQHEQYFRDLIVFGTNSIELTPDFDAAPRSSPHMVMDAKEMDAKLSDLIASYGLDVWIWFALRGNVADPALAESELKRAGEAFRNLPHLNAVYLPGGDPGETLAQDLLPFLVRLAAVLHAAHPDAKLWMSNQGFEDPETDYLLDYLKTEKPAWLHGLIFAPWAKISLQELRERAPEHYPIRTCPDITHNVRCQYPVPHWDRAFAHTLGREAANPRPNAMKHILGTQAPYSEGFVSYSDGVHDDVNKIIWSACGWDPGVNVEDVLREYGRYFIGEDLGPAIGEGLLAQEKNWQGSLRGNTGVSSTFRHWQDLEKQADDATRNNWRFQQGLMRAYYDEYLRQRLALAMQQEAAAYTVLQESLPKLFISGPLSPWERVRVRGRSEATTTPTSSTSTRQQSPIPTEFDPVYAIAAARGALAPKDAQPDAPELRKRIEELGLALFKSIGAQLSVNEPFLASGAERGAILDFLDQPLNDAPWLEMQFSEILREPDKAKQLARIAQLVHWEQPGPGSFYDDLGSPDKQPHLVPGKPWEDDPGFVDSPQDEYSGNPNLPQDRLLGDPAGAKPNAGVRLSWLDTAQTLFRAPLRMHYDHLDPNATYTLRVTYAGRFKPTLKLTADDTFEIHGPLAQPNPTTPQAFTVPKEATQDGTLDLRWEKTEGRGCQVAEVWLLQD